MVNPFTASLGVTPPLLAGRDAMPDEFTEGLDDGPGAGGQPSTPAPTAPAPHRTAPAEE